MNPVEIIRRYGRTMKGGYMVGKQLLKSRKDIREGTEDYMALKKYNDIKGKPIDPYDESNPDFRTKINAIHAKYRTEMRNKSQ